MLPAVELAVAHLFEPRAIRWQVRIEIVVLAGEERMRPARRSYHRHPPGDAFSALAVAAPSAKQRAGEGPGGSGSSEPVPSIWAKAPRLEIVDEP